MSCKCAGLPLSGSPAEPLICNRGIGTLSSLPLMGTRNGSPQRVPRASHAAAPPLRSLSVSLGAQQGAPYCKAQCSSWAEGSAVQRMQSGGNWRDHSKRHRGSKQGENFTKEREIASASCCLKRAQSTPPTPQGAGDTQEPGTSFCGPQFIHRWRRSWPVSHPNPADKQPRWSIYLW